MSILSFSPVKPVPWSRLVEEAQWLRPEQKNRCRNWVIVEWSVALEPVDNEKEQTGAYCKIPWWKKCHKRHHVSSKNSTQLVPKTHNWVSRSKILSLRVWLSIAADCRTLKHNRHKLHLDCRKIVKYFWKIWTKFVSRFRKVFEHFLRRDEASRLVGPEIFF